MLFGLEPQQPVDSRSDRCSGESVASAAANKKCGAFSEIKKMVSECSALFLFVSGEPLDLIPPLKDAGGGCVRDGAWGVV